MEKDKIAAAIGPEELSRITGHHISPDGFTLCPAHSERTPSAKVSPGDGCLRWHCFACKAGGDVFSFIQASMGGAPFPEVLREAARGLGWVPGDNWEPPPPKEMKARPKLPAPGAEARGLWHEAKAVPDSVAANLHENRGLNAFPTDTVRWHAETFGQSWSRTRAGGDWADSDHRMIFRLFDRAGTHQSLVARSPFCSAGPKSLVPSGRDATGLCMLNRLAWECVREPIKAQSVEQFMIVEGEMDFLAACQFRPKAHIVGIRPSSWGRDWGSLYPDGSTLNIFTDPDQAGQRYAQEIMATVSKGVRCLTLK